MKILFHHRIASADGQAVHIDELTSALRRAGHEVVVVGPGGSKGRSIGQSSQRVTTFKRYLPRALYELLELSYSLVAYYRLRAAYLKFAPDVLYERANLFSPAGVWLKRRYRLPMLLEVNAPIFRERSRFGGISLKRLARWSEELTWRAADFVIPVSGVLAAIIRDSGIANERIEVIPNAVDPERFIREIDSARAKRCLGLEGRMVLGFTGFVRGWHAVDRVIDLLANSLAGANLHLVVVGDGPQRRALERRASALGVTQSLTFAGPVQRAEIPRYIAAFDIALQPGVTPYASPLKLFEYMALGRAIVAPDTPNMRELLVDGETAVLFDPDDPKSLGSAIERLSGDAALRERIGANARAAIMARGLTWDNNARRTVELVRRLIPGPVD